MADRAFLLIADIGGYTRFMQYHRINLAHAQDVVAQLLEAVIDAAEPVFKLSKLEGDAALMYAPLPGTGEPDLAPMAKAIAKVRAAFLQRRADMEIDRLCTCEGCVQVSDLSLKFIAHVGEVYFQRIRRLTELAGVDVIVVHRLLKNSVPVREYVLMSEELASKIPPPIEPGSESLEEDLEGIGKMRTRYADLSALRVELVPRTPTRWRRLRAWAGMTLRTIPFLVGAKTSCDGFRNMPRVEEGAEPKTAP